MGIAKLVNHSYTANHMETNHPTNQEVQPEIKTGDVVEHKATAHKHTTNELDSGAQIAINAGIGVGNVCCGPMCYCFPTLVSSVVGLVLYFTWKDEKPKTAKTILTVTLVTAGAALLFFVAIFALGIGVSIIDELT